MGKSFSTSKDNQQLFDDQILNIKESIQQINDHICSAQKHLLSESGKMVVDLNATEISLPTAYKQIINASGESVIQKISEVKIPIGSLIPAGIFHISNVELDMPISINSASVQSTKGKEAILSRNMPEVVNNATLKLTYQYQQLSDIVSPPIFRTIPFLELKFTEFGPDKKNRRFCSAKGVIEAYDGETNEPLVGNIIHLSIENGSVMPSQGKLNNKGMIEFRILGPCKQDGSFTNTMIVLINGATRTFEISLSPE